MTSVPPDLPGQLAADPEYSAWRRANCPDVDHRAELGRFSRYWAAQASAPADWAAACRVWMRQAQWRARRPARRAAARTPGPPDPVPYAYATNLRAMTATDALLALLAGTPPPGHAGDGPPMAGRARRTPHG